MVKETTILILLDAFRFDYLDPTDTPFLWSLKDKGIWAKKLFNPGGYCERSCFMTGAGPEVTDNYFAMALMPPGYKRAPYEPTFNVPMNIRSRLAMTEDVTPDFELGSFKNWTNGETIESFWDVMISEGKRFAVEACVALGIKQYRGKTTHGTRPLQIVDKFKDNLDFYYIQYSEVDNIPHFEGSSKEKRAGLLKNVDASVEWLLEQANQHFDKVNVVVFGDHGMDDVKGKIDLALEYPPYKEGWDYLFLKSSAAVQFWTFNPEVDKHIKADPILNRYGRFIASPSPRQADILWQAHPNIMVSPCHFHDRNNPTTAMHGWDFDGKDNMDTMRAMAIVVDGKTRGEVENCDLRDICPTVCKMVGIDPPKYNEGVCIDSLLQETTTSSRGKSTKSLDQ